MKPMPARHAIQPSHPFLSEGGQFRIVMDDEQLNDGDQYVIHLPTSSMDWQKIPEEYRLCTVKGLCAGIPGGPTREDVQDAIFRRPMKKNASTVAEALGCPAVGEDTAEKSATEIASSRVSKGDILEAKPWEFHGAAFDNPGDYWIVTAPAMPEIGDEMFTTDKFIRDTSCGKDLGPYKHIWISIVCAKDIENALGYKLDVRRHNRRKPIQGCEVGGTHYKQGIATSPWDLQEVMQTSGSAFVDARRADIIKYVWRRKGDLKKLLEDLEKAEHCIRVAIAALKKLISSQP